jgi:hypothetical protein
MPAPRPSPTRREFRQAPVSDRDDCGDVVKITVIDGTIFGLGANGTCIWASNGATLLTNGAERMPVAWGAVS